MYLFIDVDGLFQSRDGRYKGEARANPLWQTRRRKEDLQRKFASLNTLFYSHFSDFFVIVK